MERKKEGKLSDALLKVALGYQVAEVTEEFAEVDGELKLTKRKRVKKDSPPDLKAVQILLSEGGEGAELEKMSDEELEREKARLIAALAEETAASAEKKTVKAKTVGVKTAEKAAGAKTVKKAAGAKTVKKTKEQGQVCDERAETAEKAVKKTRPKPKKRVVRTKKTEEKQ